MYLMCLTILLSGCQEKENSVRTRHAESEYHFDAIPLNPQSASQWDYRNQRFFEGGQGPVPRCDGDDVDFDVCVRLNGELCLCNTEVMPKFMRYPLTFQEDWSEEYRDYYRSITWPIFVPSMNGPDQLAPCRGQSLYDYDGDNDVDLLDFAEFQIRYSLIRPE